MSDEQGVLEVPARRIPVPRSVSPEAQAMLAAGRFVEEVDQPPVDDHDAWRAFIAEGEQSMAAVAARAEAYDVAVEEIDMDGVCVFVCTPGGVEAADPRRFLDIHGGGLVGGAGPLCRAMGIIAANRMRVQTWSVDYRMPPDHPYPTPLDDCVAAYQLMLEESRPADIVVGGESAGGNLAAALVLRARDEGLPLPAGVVLITPELDLTESGDSFQTNLGVDSVLVGSLLPSSRLYAGGHPLEDPYLSPLFGDFTKGFPPTLLTAGTRDLFLSNAVRMHRALRREGIEAHLHVKEAAPHSGFFGMAPEDAEIDEEIRAFAGSRWSSPG
ncbi:MAG TPA: alpha/beta hydrolase [Acidimicrobiales bacterium]